MTNIIEFPLRPERSKKRHMIEGNLMIMPVLTPKGTMSLSVEIFTEASGPIYFTRINGADDLKKIIGRLQRVYTEMAKT